MLEVRRWRHVVFPLAAVLILMLGVFGCGNGEEETVDEPNGEEEKVKINGEEEEVVDDEEEEESVEEKVLEFERGRYEGEVKDGVPHGQGTMYYEDGTISYEGEYKDGVQHGQGTEYHEDGTIVHEGEFKEGEPVQ